MSTYELSRFHGWQRNKINLELIRHFSTDLVSLSWLRIVYRILQFRTYGVDVRQWLQLGLGLYHCSFGLCCFLLVSAGAAYHPSLFLSLSSAFAACFVLAFPLISAIQSNMTTEIITTQVPVRSSSACPSLRSGREMARLPNTLRQRGLSPRLANRGKRTATLLTIYRISFEIHYHPRPACFLAWTSSST